MERQAVNGGPSLSPEIAAAVIARWPEIGPVWCTAVDAEIRELCEAYDAQPVQVFPARYGYIVEVTSPRGPLIMRASPDPDGMAQGHVAIALANLDAAPRVHELRETTTGTWMVLDKVEPGTPLADLRPSVQVIDALISLFCKLRDQPSPVPASRLLVRWLRSRLLAGDDLADLPPNTKPARPTDRAAAVAILAELERDMVPGLCHGDASPWNILASGPENLLLIDPRGVSGELTYDLAVIALKAAPFVDPADLAGELAEGTGADRSRIQAWLAVATAARV